MTRQEDMEQKALQIIMNSGEKGILQSELWRQMNASSREGSRISIRLEKRGLIHRERTLSDGRWTYRLFSKRQPITIDSILSCPCLTCNESLRCGAGGKTSPNDCELLTQWILDSSAKETEASGGGDD
ncbi:MAG: MarR family transcriptional regulator [Nitrososphaerota archaeon]|nr:MarR family transcriptional regulator [Candidatus Bathyarchaeota archaeon]MDW8048797.1 MarR family transcriptional regulator [Nitrososphaerota archaeon]